MLSWNVVAFEPRPRVVMALVAVTVLAGMTWLGVIFDEEDHAPPRVTVVEPVREELTRPLLGGELHKSSPSCVLMESVSGAQGTLALSTSRGTGTATAIFGEDVFTGTVQQDHVEMTLRKTFAWSDGCQWETRQVITGGVGGVLHFTYEEHPLPGQHGCFPPCSGSAEISMW